MSMRPITGKAVERLTKLLGLQPPQPHSQDWEAETAKLADLSSYLDCYETEQLNDDEKYALMSLILYALDSAQSVGAVDLSQSKDRVARAITADHAVQLPHLLYWTLPDEESSDPDRLFHITLFLRELSVRLGIDYKGGERDIID